MSWFGKYRLLAELGHGGMADVYLAATEGPAGVGFSKLLVVKRLRAHLADDRMFVAMQLDEARIAARLNHPNLVQTLEVGEVGGQYFLAMEFLDGQPLHRIQLRAGRAAGRFTAAMHYRILCDVLAGLHHAHELRDFDGTRLSIVHRDVSPHNVFVTYEGQVKVLDFGIAKLVGRLAETETGIVKGKIPYIAPEQACRGEVDRRADVFSVGLMLWEAATGTRLWKGLSDAQILERFIAEQIPSSPREAGHDVSEEIDRICRRALAHRPDDRYPTALALQTDLEAAVAEIESRDASGKTPVASRALGALVAELFEDRREELQSVIQKQLAALETAGPALAIMPVPEARSPVAQDHELSTGIVVEKRYRLDRLVGEGGMGVVWAATNTVTHRTVALKFVRRAIQSTAHHRRFIREARAASAVKHPNVREIYDILEHDGSPVMVMEYLAGESLARKLEREGKLPLAALLEILLPVVSAVGSAHALGIVHRDLKPENIFLVEGGDASVKVLDFGIAKLVAVEGRAAEATAVTASGALLGTPAYMAPEQVFGEKDIDHGADIWALGLMLYQGLTGALPTDADNVGQVLKIILTRPIPPLAEVAPGVPGDIAVLVQRMLSRARNERPADLREVYDVLVRHTELRAPTFGAASARAPTPESASEEDTQLAILTTERRASLDALLGEQRSPPERPRRGRRIALAIAAVAAVAGLGVLAARRSGAPSEWRPVVHEMKPTYEENAGGPVFSPDGKMIAYDSDRDGTWRIYVGPVDGGESRPITPRNPIPAFDPRFARDGQSVIYARGHDIHRVSLAGDGDVEIAREAFLADACGGRLVTASLHAEGCPECQSLTVIEADGSRRERLRVPVEQRVWSLRCDRPGRRVVYAQGEPSGVANSASSIWIADLDGGAPVRLVDDPSGGEEPVFHPDGRSILFSSERGGARNLWELALAGGSPVQLTFGGGPDKSPDVAPDGRTAMFDVDISSRPLLVVTLDGGAPRRLRTTVDDVLWIDVAADGQDLLLQIDRHGRSDVVSFSIADGTERVLAEGERPIFSVDGREVLFARASPARLLAMPRTGGPARVVAELPGRARRIVSRADGFVYLGIAGSRGGAALRVPSAGGAPEPSAPAPYLVDEPAPAGGYRAACAEGRAEVELVRPGAVPGEPSAARILEMPRGIPTRGGWFDWDFDGRSLVFMRNGVLHRRDLASGEEKELPLKVQSGFVTGRISPDGKTFYYSASVGRVRRQVITNFGDRARPPAL